MAEALRSVLSRTAGTLQIVRAWPRQRSIPFAPYEKQLELRDRRVRETVRYASRCVPYYRAQLGKLGMDPRDVRSASDLVALPLIARQDLLLAPDDFRSIASGSGCLTVRTSGSTGEPLDVLHDRASALANIAYSERERAVDIALLGRAGYQVLALEYRESTLAHVRAFYDSAAFRPRRPGFTFVPTEEPMEHALAAFDTVRPDVVVGPGSWLEVVFEAIASADRSIPLPALVVYGGSGMSPAGRELIERELGVPVLSRYNAGEALKIGYLCEAREGFHLHDDLCHVEIVDEEGAPVAESERGIVVISNLVNRGTVLLRYALGDHARLTSEPCACGRPSRRLLSLEGKRNVIMRLPDGTALHARALWGVIKQVDGVTRFQLVQHEPAYVEVRLQTADRPAFERMLPDVLPGLESLLRGCRVEATWHERLLPEPGRRFEPIVALGDAERRDRGGRS